MHYDQGDTIGDYVLEARLGAGTAGEVWHARHKRSGYEVAIKIYETLDPVQQKRFRREAEVLNCLSHPNVVPFRGFDEDHKHIFIIMGYVRGQSLAELIASAAQKGAPVVEISQIATILKSLAEALDYIHAKGLIHRDLRPSNILIEEESGRVIISDFGLVKSTLDLSRTAVGYNYTSTILYTSPEQLNSGDFSPATDLYSLGAIIYELMTGKPPFSDPANNLVTISTMIANNPIYPPSWVAKGLPPELDAVVKKVLEKDPAERYQTARDFYEAFSKALGAQAQPAAIAPETSAVEAASADTIEWERGATGQLKLPRSTVASTPLVPRFSFGNLALIATNQKLILSGAGVVIMLLVLMLIILIILR